MKMYKTVLNCRVCNGPLTQILDLGLQYVVDFVKEPDEDLLKAPLTLMKCNKCHLVQLGHSVEPDRLYRKFWYRSGINGQMREELLAVVQKAQATVDLREGDKVLDIGSNDGTLLGWYKKGVMTWGVDPCGELVAEGMREKRIDVGVPEYFSASAVKIAMAPPPKFKIITAIAMFYDLENPEQFLRDCREVLHDEGVLVIQMNYLDGMMLNTAFDNICHEHLTYFSVSTLKHVIEQAGLELQGVEMTPVNGGSFRAYVTHKGFDAFCAKNREQKVWLWANALKKIETELSHRLDTPVPYKLFEQDIATKMDDLANYILNTGGNWYAYGASTRGTTLMQYLMNDELKKRFVGVAERDPKKFGLRMVGTWLPIVPEDEARKNCKDMLVLPWHFKDSIEAREKQWVQEGGSLTFPLPTLTTCQVQGRMAGARQ